MDVMKFKVALIINLILFLSLSSPAFSAKNLQEPSKPFNKDDYLFEIRKVEGVVFYWSPLGNRWHEMKAGLFLTAGTIVQVQESANIDYRFLRKQEDKWFGDQAYLSFKSSVSFRLDANIIRSSNLVEQFLDSPPKNNVNDSQKFSLLYDSISYAWNRMVAYVNATKENKDFITDLLAAPKQDVQLGFRAKKIKLLKPDNGAAVFVFQFPAKIPLVWQINKEVKGPYGIHIWQGNQSRPAASVEVQSDQYDLLVDRPGSYYIQISAEKGRFLSAPHTVHIGNLVAADETMEDWLRAKYPQQNTVLASERKNRKILMQWFVNSKEDFTSVKLTVQNLDSKSLTRIFNLNKNIDHYELDLTEGSYLWWLEGVVKVKVADGNVTERKLTTEKRRFELRSVSSPRQLISKALSAAKKEKTVKRIIFEDGL